MPNITDQPPATVRQDLEALTVALDGAIPAKSADNLLIATWNIRSFASLTRKWTAGSNDSPKRDLRGLRAIIEILSRFDVVAVQELKGDLRALRDTMKFLGQEWGFLMTDVTLGDKGNNERLAFVYNQERVKPSGLAAELVVPPERLDRIGEDALRTQFCRTPYAVSFIRGESTFILVTLHILFGDVPADRVPELAEIANFFKNWARNSNRWHHNLLCLGDFNIDRRGSPLFDAFTNTGLSVPPQLEGLPRTVFDDPAEGNRNKFYDQIAWFTTGQGALLDLELRAGGNFDFQPHVYTDQDLTRSSKTYRVSDHFPLWVEFALPN